MVVLRSRNKRLNMKIHDASFFEVKVRDNYIEAEDVETEEDNYGEIGERDGAEIVEDNGDNMERHAEKELVRIEDEDNKDKIDKAEEYEGVKAAGFVFKAYNIEQMMVAKSDETTNVGSSCLEKEVKSSYMVGLNEENINKIEAAETEIIGVGKVEPETQSSGQLLSAKTDESEEVDGYVWDKEIEGSIPLQDVKSISEEKRTESEGVDDTESLELNASYEKLTDFVNEVDEIGYSNEVEIGTTGRNISAAVGISIVIILSTSLAFIHHCSKKERSTLTEESRSMLKSQKFAVEENITPVPSVERKVEFFARPSSSSSHSMEEAPKVLNHHIHAPTVELIGEIIVGQVSSLRSSGKYQMTETEKNNATFSANHGSLPQPVSILTKPSAVGHSTFSSPSYGSFTTEKKISKKEAGQSQEASTEVTPVRRSSRLRNRAAVTSP